MSLLRIAVIGCGKIADQHIAAIRRIPQTTIVAACDREELMAEQLAERNRIPYFSADTARMLEEVRPDVVHITTPPASHCALAVQCLECGCHVYVEKPFTLDAAEAERILDVSRRVARQVTVGHNLQYTWENIEARRLVRSGFLGGTPVHIESYFTYGFGNVDYARALLGDRQHWVRRLPGGLLQNIISHGIARIAELMATDDATVFASGHTSPLLLSIGESEIVDELRVQLHDGRNTTATFVFSSQLAPPVNGYRVYGPKNSLTVDNVHHTVVCRRARGLKSYLNYFLPPVLTAREYLGAARRNVTRFIRAEFHDDSGLKNYIEAFYRAILDPSSEPPASAREILFTARVMDRVFAQLAEQRRSRVAPAELSGATV